FNSNSKVYTEDEANEAMSLIQEHELPMSDLHYALKYVRILHQGHDPQDPQKEVEKVPEVSPPEFDGDYEETLERFVIRDG
ncbi:hypothetical protein KR200_008352, partial [Drosophila serrata]